MAQRLITRRPGVVPLIAGLLLAVGPAAVPPAQAQQQGGAGAADHAVADTMGAMTFIFYHELGHALIDALQLPTVGPEEDVADEFAAYMLTITGQRDDRDVRALVSGVRSWARMAETESEPTPYWDEHSLSIKRFYNTLCLLYGSNPGRFYPLVVDAGVPHERAQRCEQEYQEKLYAWIDLLEPYLIVPGTEPPADRGRLRVVYQPARSPASAGIGRVLQQSRFYEVVVSAPNSLLILPTDIPVIAAECGQPNAFWDPGAGTITMCYEMAALLRELFSEPRDLQAETFGQGATRTTTTTAPAAAPMPEGEGMRNITDMLESD